MARPELVERPKELNDKLFHLAAEAVTDFAIFLLDPNGQITSWNPGSQFIFGYEPSEIIGQPFSRLFTAEDQAAGVPDRELGLAAANGSLADMRWHARKDGTRLWITGVTTALRDADRALQGFVKIIRDATDQKEFQDMLRGRTEALLEANKRKNLFIATLAHELKNPLAPIVYAAQILQQRVGEHLVLREPLEIIEQQATLLTRIVEDLLDVVRAETGKVSLNKERVQLGPILQSAVKAVRPLIEARSHQLRVSEPQQPVWLEADVHRLQQVFMNLLINAAKYTETGGTIWLSTTVEGADAVVRIRDTGVGIPAETLPHIFALFTQADPEEHLTKGGLGIGLALAKSLIELHDGSVQASSDGPGKGSEFTVRLPLKSHTVPGVPASMPAG